MWTFLELRVELVEFVVDLMKILDGIVLIFMFFKLRCDLDEMDDEVRTLDMLEELGS